MANINAGPAITNNPNSVAVLTPANSVTNSTAQGSNALRLLAAFRGVSLNGTGDAAAVGVINATTWAAATIVVTNGLVSGVSATVATASVGIFTGAAATGTTVRTGAVLTGQTASTVVTAAAAASAAVASTAQTLYLNVGTALANATVDIFVYGYDLT
jgi:hypothetical protein